MRLATDIGRQQGIRLALAFSRSVDAIHPPVLEDLGFGADPVSMRGFRHDLISVPSRALPPELTLRPVRVPDELDMLCEHSARAFDDPGTQGQPLYRSYFEYEATRPDYSPEQLSIAEASGEPIAHLFLTHDHGDKRETLQLSEIGVRPEFRGRGIGSALVSHALSWARRHGAQALLTSCQSTNPAATAYWRLGFRPDPLRSYRYYTRPLDIADAGS
jgi:GNAT superfamily N-acetyltransferase